MIKINKRDKLNNINDIFVFGKQCQKVYYKYTHSFRNDSNIVHWLYVMKTKPMSHVQIVKDYNDEVTGGEKMF